MSMTMKLRPSMPWTTLPDLSMLNTKPSCNDYVRSACTVKGCLSIEYLCKGCLCIEYLCKGCLSIEYLCKGCLSIEYLCKKYTYVRMYIRKYMYLIWAVCACVCRVVV